MVQNISHKKVFWMKTSACRDETLKSQPNKMRTTQHIHTIPVHIVWAHCHHYEISRPMWYLQILQYHMHMCKQSIPSLFFLLLSGLGASSVFSECSQVTLKFHFAAMEKLGRGFGTITMSHLLMKDVRHGHHLACTQHTDIQLHGSSPSAGTCI